MSSGCRVMTRNVVTGRQATSGWSCAMGTEVWILGGTGRSGQVIAAELVRRALSPVLVGRDAARLAQAEAHFGGQTVLAPTVEAMTAEIRRRQPAVVINTVGPFTAT